MFSQTQENNQIDTGLCVRPYRDDNLPFPTFEKPTRLGVFSVTTERDYEPTAVKLRYFKPPKTFPFDLNIGVEQAIKKPEFEYDERIDHLLMFICDHKEQLLKSTEMASKPRIAAEFICWRGLLRLLMCTPSEFRRNWCIHVSKYLGTFYLCKRDSQHDKLQRKNEPLKQKRMTAWGYKFQQHCLSRSPFVEPNTNEPVDECAEFHCVFKTKMNGMEILYGAVMNGIISDQTVQLDERNINNLQDLQFVELKTRQGDLHPAQQEFYKHYKTRDWWCQSILVGIQDLYEGIRTDEGLVERIDHVDLRVLAKQASYYWTPKGCVSFLTQFLTVLKKVMATENCPYTVYGFYFNTKTSRVTFECFKGKTEHSFLPDFYLSMLQQVANDEVSQKP